MKKPAAPRPINLPYASTVASFFGDQGSTTGTSFLGGMFNRGGAGGSAGGGAGGAMGRPPAVRTQIQPPNARRR